MPATLRVKTKLHYGILQSSKFDHDALLPAKHDQKTGSHKERFCYAMQGDRSKPKSIDKKKEKRQAPLIYSPSHRTQLSFPSIRKAISMKRTT